MKQATLHNSQKEIGFHRRIDLAVDSKGMARQIHTPIP